MDIKSINYVKMLQTTQNCLASNRSLFQNVPSIQRASAEVDAVVAKILTAQREQTSKEGLAREKSTVRAELVEAAHELASLAHACATEHGYDIIAQRTDLSRSYLESGSEIQFIDVCRGLVADTEELTDHLGECGMTPEKVNHFKELIAAFDAVKPKPRRGVAVSKSATSRLPVLIRRASHLLRSRLDRLMVPFKKTHPEFYGEYKVARKIVNQSATRSVAKFKIVSKPESSASEKSKVA